EFIEPPRIPSLRGGQHFVLQAPMQEREEKPQGASDAFIRKVARLKDMHPSDIAAEIDDLESKDMRRVLRKFSPELAAEVLTELRSEIQTDLLENMRVERLADIIPEMYSDDAADAWGNV